MRRRLMPNLLGDYASLEQRQAVLERIMQSIGFSPELPYTLTVNDGTLNRVLIGKINGDYGIKILDNAGNTILLANGTIIADAIKSGTLDCDLITVANLSAEDIVTGTLSADFISGGILNCGTMTVTNLSAGSITTGTFANINARLPVTSIHGDKIQTGTLQANRIVAESITANQIAAHSISGDELAFNTITASHMNVVTLSAISANLGTITAGSITAGIITAGTLNVDRIPGLPASKTTSGEFAVQRIPNLSANKITTGTLTIKDTISWLKFQNSSGVQQGSIYGASTYLYINATNGVVITNDLYFTPNKSIYTHNITLSGNLDTPHYVNAGGINNTYFYGNNIWYWNLYYYSDEILKKSIESRSKNLDDIMKLQPKEFKYKKDKEGKRHIGLIAQEVEEILPELIGKDKDGNKGIDTTQMIPILIGAVKELKEEVELLKKEVKKNADN